MRANSIDVGAPKQPPETRSASSLFFLLFPPLLFFFYTTSMDEINPLERKTPCALALSCSHVHHTINICTLHDTPPPLRIFFTKLFSAISSTHPHNSYRHLPPRPFASIPSPCTAVPIPLYSSCSRAGRAPRWVDGKSHQGGPIRW